VLDLKLEISRLNNDSVPNNLILLGKICKIYNKLYTRKFVSSLRCLALAFDGSRIVEYGENKLKTHPFLKKMYHDKNLMSIHAEADLVMKLLKNDVIDKITDIVVLRGTSKLLSSHPCSICYGLLQMYLPNVRLWWFDADIKKWKVKLI
jgi:hypothetical protein